jgi:hypothetical protein
MKEFSSNFQEGQNSTWNYGTQIGNCYEENSDNGQ